MSRSLTDPQIECYARDGYLSPLDAFTRDEASAYRARLEDGERRFGGLPHDRRRKMHLYLKWVDEIVHDARVLDAVESVIGPDILLFHLTCWIKEPRTDAFISWHQDSTYFGLNPAEHVTAWVALSPSNADSGCVQVIPGTHLQGQVAHHIGERERNMLPGQQLDVPAGTPYELMVLEPGQFSLHHTYLHHNSMPNHSDDRRIGLGISYIPTRCRCSAAQRLSAMLVRGTDRYRHFDLETRPEADYAAAALARHAEAMARWQTARVELIERAHGQAA